MKPAFLILFSFISVVAFGQPHLIGGFKNMTNGDFSSRWKADSLGKNLFRDSALIEDTITRKIVSVNGINIKQYTNKEIFAFLGEPNKIIHNGGNYTFDYFLAPYYAFSEAGKYKYVLEVSFENNMVVDFYTSFIDDSNDAIDVDTNGKPIKKQ